jgi:hypothetical protein
MLEKENELEMKLRREQDEKEAQIKKLMEIQKKL